MLDVYTMRREVRYGCPAADQVLFNRYFVVGYSYYFRQAKWALEIVDPDKKDLEPVERLNNFRPDYRIPERFRADLSDYRGQGYDRGHLVASANQIDENLQNSETFLLSNMSPQAPTFNRQIWRKLEAKVRDLNARDSVLETYVITGPIFDFFEPIVLIGESDSNGVSIPVPSHFYKCILTEEMNGSLKLWAFELPNTELDGELEDYLVPADYIERRAGILLWGSLQGSEIDREKARVRSLW
ncbi:DNA/RNA non-specific endonuclease [Gilvimarinus sp. SDUM040013]|uniref:Endonuclease n=1 Tax=Gilvimarinus gilvus TaxID=3058038 RepID=A0ABU4S0A9_9GAMM|nr:DNA/RNA non-specific endonuclease [Gilvimarinus sp. SDUM040013]MDO3386120.1 DNA/RNA non-specific endonuclease [Gilvimarinus sp. SDUM040013]MDX6850339.1 DNA/RNA non-specific endonuclease [Gilvimarinus sp. SDUM040013]